MRIYYAQNREDLFIRAFFPDVKNGFYVDVGANDPVIDSVTKLLYDEGWSGINVEPIQSLADALRRDRPRDLTLQVGISNKAGVLTFTEYLNGNGLSTFDLAMREYYEQGNHQFPTENLKEYSVEVRTLSDVIEQAHPPHIHVLKIDVEGYEYEVIESNDWTHNRPELVCIEANHISRDWRPMLKRQKYKLVFFDGVNEYYLADESAKREEYFDYPDIALAGNPIYYPAYLEMRSEEEGRLAVLSNKLHDEEENIALLHRQQRDVRFLAKQLAKEVQLRLNKRAKRTIVHNSLYYKHDVAIERALRQKAEDKEKLLMFIHNRDKVNIQVRHRTLRDLLRSVPWKIAAYVFAIGIMFAKQAAKRIG